MKSLRNLILFLSFALLISSCSKDDEPDPSQVDLSENPQVGLFVNEDGESNIRVPKAMLESSDPYATTANSYIALATSFGTYATFFEVPEDAVERSQPISASNGRMAASGYTVYEWTDLNGGAIAYQFSEQGDQELFEIFFKEGGKDYLKLLDVSQNKDGKSGTMNWYDETGVALNWSWELRSDESYLLSFDSEDFNYEIISNKDYSGSLKSYSNDNLDLEMEWDSVGNGSWKEYDSGSLVDEGNWAV